MAPFNYADKYQGPDPSSSTAWTTTTPLPSALQSDRMFAAVKALALPPRLVMLPRIALLPRAPNLSGPCWPTSERWLEAYHSAGQRSVTKKL